MRNFLLIFFLILELSAAWADGVRPQYVNDMPVQLVWSETTTISDPQTNSLIQKYQRDCRLELQLKEMHVNQYGDNIYSLAFSVKDLFEEETDSFSDAFTVDDDDNDEEEEEISFDSHEILNHSANATFQIENHGLVYNHTDFNINDLDELSTRLTSTIDELILNCLFLLDGDALETGNHIVLSNNRSPKSSLGNEVFTITIKEITNERITANILGMRNGARNRDNADFLHAHISWNRHNSLISEGEIDIKEHSPFGMVKTHYTFYSY